MVCGSLENMSCEHKHHDHPSAEPPTGLTAILVLFAVPLGLLVCQQCGVHFCADELAATLDLWRVTANTMAALRGRGGIR